MTIRKVGGIRFMRIGRFQFSFCKCKRRAMRLNIAGHVYNVNI